MSEPVPPPPAYEEVEKTSSNQNSNPNWQAWCRKFISLDFNQDEAVEYAKLFINNDIEISMIPELNDSVLKSIGIEKAGHRIRILRLQKQNSVQIPQQVATAAAPQPNINALRCAWHPNTVANEKCYKCNRLVCLHCRQQRTHNHQKTKSSQTHIYAVMDSQLINIVLLGVVFMILFIEFQTTSMLSQSVLEGMKNETKNGAGFQGSGYMSQGILNVCLAIVNILAPVLVSVVDPAVAFFYASSVEIQWQLLILTTFLFVGTLVFFSVLFDEKSNRISTFVILQENSNGNINYQYSTASSFG